MDRQKIVEQILNSRQTLRPSAHLDVAAHGGEAEGGCGVIGIACSEQIAGRHLLQSLDQMRNRGNGKGGGVAIVGLVADELGVDQAILENDYLLAIAYLDTDIRPSVEKEFIYQTFEVDHLRYVPHIENHTDLPALEVKPPEVYQYFVRPKDEAVEAFIRTHHLEETPRRQVEDELVYQNSYRLNSAYYSAIGEKQAFVLSHGKNLFVLKMVGYGDDVIRYYQLEDLHAHVWIGHHRYPTKGKVWHPGGAHPFVGVNEALVHNGDFANYASIAEYLAQREIYPLFLTDTEVSVQVFDLLHRIYGYPLEYVIESLAPTTERDFTLLPADKRRIYEMLQITHMHSSPDGPWFFLIAQSDRVASGHRDNGHVPPSRFGEESYPSYRLIGITDTSMLRPQVFAWQQVGADGPAIGFAASEKQAIDAALGSLASADTRFWSRADRYWNARGGSHTDGGAFIFSVYPNSEGPAKLVCTDKFGRQIQTDPRKVALIRANGQAPKTEQHSSEIEQQVMDWVTPDASHAELFTRFQEMLPSWDYEMVQAFLRAVLVTATTENHRQRAFDLLTTLMDRHYQTGHLRRSSLLSLYDQGLSDLVKTIRFSNSGTYDYVGQAGWTAPADTAQRTILIDARGFDPEGEGSLALEIVRLIKAGYRKFLVIHARGHRFIGNGIGPAGKGVRIDVYGSSGDYLGSGIDGVALFVHGNAQDQVAQIMKNGKLVIHGDVGQTFMYAAKGGEAYVLGNAAGRPLINAVGNPRVVINGTCLDYLAESFMAGDPLKQGGFVILNGMGFNDEHQLIDLETPYPGGNLFSLASGGAIYVRDSHHKLGTDQLNGGEFSTLKAEDWVLIRPYLEENERLFNIPLARLLEVDGEIQPPEQVYRKIQPKALRALQAEEAWVQRHS